MRFSTTLSVALVATFAALAHATNVHMNYYNDGWIQDSAGSEWPFNYGDVLDIGDGWAFFWIESDICSQNSVTWTWPSNYGDVYMEFDGYLHDGSGNIIGTARIC